MNALAHFTARALGARPGWAGMATVADVLEVARIIDQHKSRDGIVRISDLRQNFPDRAWLDQVLLTLQAQGKLRLLDGNDRGNKSGIWQHDRNLSLIDLDP